MTEHPAPAAFYGLSSTDPDPARPYNGYTNYQTWNIALWITNTETAYRALVARSAARNNAPFTALDAKALVMELYPKGTPDLRHNWPANRAAINFSELADAFTDYCS